MERFLVLLLEIVMIVKGIGMFSQRTINWKIEIIFIMIGQGIGYPLFLWIGTPAIFAVLAIYLVILISLTRKLLSSLLAIIIPLIIIILSQFLVSTVMVLFSDRWNQNIGEFILGRTLVVCLFAYILMILSRNVFRRIRFLTIINNRYGWILSLFFICTLAVFYASILVDQYMGVSYETTTIRSLFFSIYSLLLIGVLLIFRKLQAKESEIKTEKLLLESEKSQMEYFTVQAERMFEFHDKIMNFKHDYKNILLGLSERIRQNDMEGLKQYFSSQIEHIGEELDYDDYKMGQFKNLQVPEIRGIITAKFIMAQGLGIDINLVMMGLVTQFNVELVTLSRILGILLDNAIEETEHLEVGKVMVIMRKEETYLMITVANNYRGNLPAIDEMFTKGFSTKGKGRGKGLCSLDELQKASPVIRLETEIKGEMFCQHIKILGGN